MGFDSDGFYIVRKQRLHPTLLLQNDGAYLSPAAPYREFTQTAEIHISQGRPRIDIHRWWGQPDGSDTEQKLSVIFRWNPRTEKFTSPHAGRLSLKEPSSWTADELPRPPATVHKTEEVTDPSKVDR